MSIMEHRLPLIVRYAMAATVGTVSVIIDTVVLVYARLVIRKVTPGTVRLILGRRPIYRFGVTLVTLRTGKVPTMVEGFVD